MKKSGNRLEGIGERIDVRLTLLEEALGMTPGDPEIYGNWIASKAPEPEVGAEEVGVIEGMDAVEDATTCFPRTEDGVPFCWDYQIKGFFKDACSSLRRVPGTRSSKLTAFKKVIDGTVFVEQRRIPFQLPEGAECGRCERPLRASSFDTSNVTAMQVMFGGCSSLEELDVSGFNTSKAVKLWSMFKDCSSLKKLDVSGFDTSKADTLKEMFSGCSTLTELDVSGFVTSNVEPGLPYNPTGIQWMFADCQKIKFLDLTGFDTRNLATNAGALSAFSNNRMLERIKVGRNCIANFPRPDKNYIPGADGKWYNSAGVGFDEIPSNVADTYSAIPPRMSASVIDSASSVDVSMQMPNDAMKGESYE